MSPLEKVIFFSSTIVFLCSLEVGICIAVQVCMLQIPILVLFNAFYVRPLQLTVSQSPPVFQCNHTLSVSVRMWDSCCYSVTCTCGPASSALYSSTTSSWMASLTIFRVRWTIKVIIKGDCMNSRAESLWDILHRPQLMCWFSISAVFCFSCIRHCTGGHLPHPSGSLLLCSFPGGLLIPGPFSSCGLIPDLVCFVYTYVYLSYGRCNVSLDTDFNCLLCN